MELSQTAREARGPDPSRHKVVMQAGEGTEKSSVSRILHPCIQMFIAAIQKLIITSRTRTNSYLEETKELFLNCPLQAECSYTMMCFCTHWAHLHETLRRCSHELLRHSSLLQWWSMTGRKPWGWCYCAVALCYCTVLAKNNHAAPGLCSNTSNNYAVSRSCRCSPWSCPCSQTVCLHMRFSPY